MGLLRGIARTAAIAGTATAVSNRVSRRQANRWAAKDQQAEEAAQYEQQQQYEQQPPPQYAPPPQQYAQPQYAQPQYAQPQYAPPPEPPAAPAAEPLSTDDMLEQLKKLGELKEAGVLTDAEFQASKAKILGS
ncbi:SHOCT domain-containing protein [Nakamurella sp.]|uniref:SHOCT domain-containing protein n=1 Tax=Nakamurella sp. TaxID=1869182 RepID=UPI003B3A429E